MGARKGTDKAAAGLFSVLSNTLLQQRPCPPPSRRPPRARRPSQRRVCARPGLRLPSASQRIPKNTRGTRRLSRGLEAAPTEREARLAPASRLPGAQPAAAGSVEPPASARSRRRVRRACGPRRPPSPKWRWGAGDPEVRPPCAARGWTQAPVPVGAVPFPDAFPAGRASGRCGAARPALRGGGSAGTPALAASNTVKSGLPRALLQDTWHRITNKPSKAARPGCYPA